MEPARVVLVTNVGQGFGRAVALSYGQAGYDVVCADPDVELASKAAAEVEELGAQAIPVQADFSEQLDVRNAFFKVHEIFGDLSGVVHVAFQQSQTAFPRLTDGEFAELLRDDVTSTFLVLREATRTAPPAWVVIVTPPRVPERPQMAAVHGAVSAMASAFSGGNALARREALELPFLGAPGALAKGRPRVNVVVPSRGPSDPRHDARLANVVRYLGSVASRGVTGATVAVDLPPSPRVIETLLPEVRAALDDTLRQDDREVDREGADEPSDAFDDDGLDDLLDGGDDAYPDAAADDELLELDGLGEARDEEASLEAEGLDDDGISESVRALSDLNPRDPYRQERTAGESRRHHGEG